MNIKRILLIVGGFILFAILFAVAWILTAPPETTTSEPAIETPNAGSFFPVSQSTGGPDTGSIPVVNTSGHEKPATSTSITLATKDGGALVANNFLNNSSTTPDQVNEGRYLLAGTLEYCEDDPACHAADADGYSISYESGFDLFTISLNREPLGEVRYAAETHLERILGIDAKGMCRLKYLVGTTVYINEDYAGKNLGFSFCPGAVILP